MTRNILSLSFAVVVLASCNGGKKAECKKPINPNGDSELALLMREMAKSTESWRDEVKEGEVLTELDLSRLKTATPTDSTVPGPEFNGFADTYLASVEHFLSEDSISVYRFNLMVDQCMNCHSSFCPGPMKRIEKMYIRSATE